MRAIRKTFVLSLLALTGAVWVGSAQAVPAFARKYEKNCSACHYAWPQLNKAGRMFKEAGYQFPSDAKNAQVISDFLYWDKYFPVSSIMVARPYDKKDSGDRKLRALHEVELIMAGVIGKNWSGYFEIEAEDENDFEAEVGSAVVGFHLNKAFNAQLVRGPYMWADPYGFLLDHFRMTRGHVGVIDQGFGGADNGGKLRSTRQMVSLYGRPIDRLFYNVGLSGESSDAEGVNASNLHGRLAFDITSDIMIGAFTVSGETDAATTTSTSTTTVGGVPGVMVETSSATPARDFSRTGVDFQADFGNARIQAAYVKGTDDNASATAEEDNSAFSVQGMYAFKKNRRPVWVPVVRYDQYEKKDGREEYKELTLNITRYFTQNVKAYLEYWDRFDVPAGKKEDNRLTLQLFVAF